MARPAGISDSSPVLETRTPPAPTSSGGKLGTLGTWLDDRTGLGKVAKGGLRKIFPDHWSFLLGEIAIYSFVILLLTGIFLSLWFKPSMAEVEYNGSYQLLKGLPMSEAFASAVSISFDVRGGLLIRQIHHWAAMLFVGAATIHMLRVFFTGAFRKPREINWLLGVGMFSMSLVEGFAGYSLPDDLLSGTGLRFVDGLIRSVPLVGTWVEFLVFGGEFPGTAIIPRLYIVHVLLLPGLLLGLVGAHLALVVYHKHTQFPGPGRTEKNVVGYPLFPVYAAKAGGFFFIVFGVTVLMGALLQINPVWMFGPYNPSQVTAGSQPDWYMGWVEGAIRIMAPVEWHLFGTTWSWNIFIPGVLLMGLLFTSLGVWPFVEAWLTGDTREHHLLDRPRNAPTRTALGVAGMTCYGLFWLAGGNDIIATNFHVSLNAVTYFMRVAVFVGPVVAYLITKRICLSLQRADAERVLHGSESGVIVRSPEGGYSEAHEPLPAGETFTLTQHDQLLPLEPSPDTDARGVRAAGRGVTPLRSRLSAWYLGQQVPKVMAPDLHAHADHTAELPGAVDDSDKELTSA